jgi:hypothetical protein
MTYPGIENDPAALALDPDRVAVEQRRREREEEYGAYVATGDIPWGNVLAFVAGDQVPKSTVERLGWLELGLVAKTGTKAAAAATGDDTAPAKTTTKTATTKSGSEA